MTEGTDDRIITIPNVLTHNEELESILSKATLMGASDVFISSDDRIWAELHGYKHNITRRKLSNSEVSGLLNLLCGSHATSYLGEGNRIDKSYDFEIAIDGVKTRFRFRLNATSHVQKGGDGTIMTLRTIPTGVPDLSKMGVEQEIIDCAKNTDMGLILVCGGTGNGKSTLLAGIIGDMLQEPDGHRNIITIEKPIEFVYDSISKPTSFIRQIEIGRSLKSFPVAVENALRMAPDVILIGEARDYETISSTVNASITGHTVFSTVHANTTQETVSRMISVYPEELRDEAKNTLNDALAMIVVQRLVPSVDGKRVALRSFLEFNDEVKEIISNTSRDHLTKVVKDLTRERGQSMYQSARKLFDQGRITETTLRRVQFNYGD